MMRNSEIYFRGNYDTKERFCSYWHQIDEILVLREKKILYIGVGNGFVPNYLKNKDVFVRNVDTEIHLKPDIVGSVLRMPLADASFGVVVCCEVLEHLPYARFCDSLSEIARVTKKYAILSLPDVTTVYRIDLQLPRMSGRIQKLITHPFHRPVRHIYDGEHYWEIGKRGYPLRRITEDIEESGFGIKNTYRVFENSYHRFFVLERENE